MKAPPPKESELQQTLIEALDTGLSPYWRYSHIGHGEKRDKATAAKLKRMGVKPGLPDFIFIHKSGAVFWLELKRPGGRASPVQKEMHAFLQHGGNFFMTGYVEDAIIELTAMGIIRNVTVMA